MGKLFDSLGAPPSKRSSSAPVTKPGSSIFDSLAGTRAAGVEPHAGQIPGEVDPTDIAKAQAGINTHLDKILGSSAPEKIKKKAKKKSVGDQAKGLFGKVLSGLDLPRATVVAGLHQLERFNPNTETRTVSVDKSGKRLEPGSVVKGLDGQDVVVAPEKVEKGIKPSFSEDVKKHIGVQEVLSENKSFKKLPGPAKIALGLTGDIALDPLNFLGPEKAIAEKGGKEGIALLLEKAGLPEAGARVLKDGVSAGTREELKAVGIKGGLYFNIPGTGHVTNHALGVFGKSVKLRQIPILRHGGLGTEAMRGLQRVTGLARDHSSVLKFLAAHGNGKLQILKADLRSGDPERALQALHGIRDVNAGVAKGAGFEAIKGKQIEPLIADAEKRGLSLQELSAAVAGDPEGIAKAAEKGVDLEPHRAWWDSVVNEANLVHDPSGKTTFINKAENYVARFRSEEAAAKLGTGAGRSAQPFERASLERARLKPGDDWMGYNLVKPGEVSEVTGEAAASVEKQINDINVKVFGSEAVPLFEDNYRKIVGVYLNSVSKRVGEKATERALTEHGVIAERFAQHVPSKRFLKKASKAAKLQAEAEDLAGHEAQAAAELQRAQRALDTHNQNAAETVGAAGRDARRQAEVLQRGVDEAQAAQEAVHARVAERLGIVQEARSRVSTLIGENNHPYERYNELLDAREGLQQRIHDLNDALEEGSASAKAKATPELRKAVQDRMDALEEKIAWLEGHPVVDSHLEVEALQQQLDDLTLARKSGQEVRAEMHDLNRTMNDLNTKLDKLSSHPRVVQGLREGMDLAEAQASDLRRLWATYEGMSNPAEQDQLARELWSRLYPESDATPWTIPRQDEVQAAINKLDVQGELHRRELERLGENPDIVPPRELPAIEHDLVFLRPAYDTAVKRAKVWREAETRATLWANTPLHQDAVEAAEAIKRLKQQSGFLNLSDINEQVSALKDHLLDLQKEHYARRAYEGQILPEKLAGEASQVRAQINRVQAAREKLGVEWNVYDEKLAHMEHELSALKANSDGVLEHAERSASIQSAGLEARSIVSKMNNELPDEELQILLNPPDEVVRHIGERNFVGVVDSEMGGMYRMQVNRVERVIQDAPDDPEVDVLQKWLDIAKKVAPDTGVDSSVTQTTKWWHYTNSEDVNFHNDPSPSHQANTWGGMHGADNPMSSSHMGNNWLSFEMDSGKVKAYGEDPLGYGDPGFPHPQRDVNSEGGHLGDVYGVNASLGEAQQEAEMFEAAWDRGIITPKVLADRDPAAAAQWNEVGRILENDPEANVTDAMAHVFGGGDAEDWAGSDMLTMDGNTHPLSPAYARQHQAMYSLRADFKQQVRKAYRDEMRSQGFDSVVYWNETEDQLRNAGGGPHWSIIVTNPSAARIVDKEGAEEFLHNVHDYRSYSDYIEFRSQTGVDRQLLHDTELALADSKGIANQADAVWANSQELVKANEVRLRAIEDKVMQEVGQLSEHARTLAADEYSLRHEAQAALERADSAEAIAAGPMVQQSLKLEAARNMAEAKLAQLGHAKLEAQNLAHVALGKAAGSFAEHAVDALHDGMQPWGQGKMIPDHIAEALLDAQKVVTPEGMQRFLEYHDKALSLWKAYAIMTPGFHFRNFFGGQFNMYLQGVDVGVQRRFIKAYASFNHAFKSSLDVEEALSHIKDVKYRDVFKQIHEAGIMPQGQISHEIQRSIAGKGNLNPFSTNFKPLRRSAKMGEALEGVMRGASAADVLLKGGTMDDAIATVYKFHFNYDDLSKFEKGFAKRVVPFYTWTRKNFTLQIEQLLRQPNKYKKYLDVKRNLEFGTTEPGVTPDYFQKGLGIRLPGWAKAGGQNSYLLPDLPFKSLAMDTPSEFVSSASPFVKTPIELWAGKQFFAGLPITDQQTIAPRAWMDIPGLMPALGAIGKAQKDKKGRWVMSGKDAYLVEQFAPPLGRARRLLPNEAKYKQRLNTTALSMMFGVGVRTNTIQGQYSEYRRRDRELSAIIADLKDRGYIDKPASDTHA